MYVFISWFSVCFDAHVSAFVRCLSHCPFGCKRRQQVGGHKQVRQVVKPLSSSWVQSMVKWMRQDLGNVSCSFSYFPPLNSEWCVRKLRPLFILPAVTSSAFSALLPDSSGFLFCFCFFSFWFYPLYALGAAAINCWVPGRFFNLHAGFFTHFLNVNRFAVTIKYIIVGYSFLLVNIFICIIVFVHSHLYSRYFIYST